MQTIGSKRMSGVGPDPTSWLHGDGMKELNLAIQGGVEENSGWLIAMSHQIIGLGRDCPFFWFFQVSELKCSRLPR